jgi:hypothetical protein
VSLVHLIDFFWLVFNDPDDSDDDDQPKNKAETSLTILYRTDGFPLLPAIDFDTISPTSGRTLLAAYILGMWGMYWKFLMFQQCFNF